MTSNITGAAPTATRRTAPRVVTTGATEATEAAVVVDGLRVERGGRPVLGHLDLSIPAGIVTGLLGPSGAGKSTLMRAIVGVQAVRSGTVTVLGSPAGSAALRRRVGYVTQAPSVYEDLTVEQNLQYFARLAGVGRGRVGEVLAQVDLESERTALSGHLSGGQLSRVSLACALVTDPDLLVLDEPTVGLDPVLRRSLWALFDELAASGTTLLVSSHVMDEAARCDELVLMRDGAVLAHEGLDSLLARTGTTDAEAAFLALVDDAGIDDAGETGPGAGSAGQQSPGSVNRPSPRHGVPPLARGPQDGEQR
jgi:ABC-2 type transport system ATP-binding protein